MVLDSNQANTGVLPMRKSILVLLLFLIPTGSFAEPEFHKGSVSIKSFTDDGSFKVTGQAYD